MKTGVRWLARELGRRISGVMAMRGDMPQSLRTSVMQGFREGKIRILVATDVVGRGIDVEGISHVINYDVPEDPENYVHRVGRTGRMGKDGKAFTFVTREQGKELTAIESFSNHQLAQDTIDGFVSCGNESPASQPLDRTARGRTDPEATPVPHRYPRGLSR
jgi:ATP-dependent RNA helicase DeaD